MAPREATNELRDLRRWHLGGGDAEPLPDGALPALLARFRDPTRVRHDYPLVLEAGDELRARPIGEALAELAEHAKAQPRVLQDNLQRLEREVRRVLADDPQAEASEALRVAGERMIGDDELLIATYQAFQSRR